MITGSADDFGGTDRFSIERSLCVPRGRSMTLVRWTNRGASRIELRIRPTEMGTFLPTARAPDKRFDLLLAGITGDLSLSYLDALFATRQRGGALDYTGYHKAALDGLLDAARNAPPGEAERRAWRYVQAALDTLAPATWIYHARGLQGVSSRVRGASMDLRGELVTVHDWMLAPSGPR